MRKLPIFLMALSLSVVSPQLLAQLSTNQRVTAPDSAVLKSPDDMPDYNALPPSVNLLKNAIRNSDGSMTINAGQQTSEANDINRHYCTRLGGIDVTNESDQKIGSGTLYAVVCKRPADQPGSAKQQSMTGSGINPLGKK